MNDCPGSGRLDTFASSAVLQNSMATGKPSRARVHCAECGRYFNGRVVTTTGGIPLDHPHVAVPRHRAKEN